MTFTSIKFADDPLSKVVGRMVTCGHSNPDHPIGEGFSYNKLNHPYAYDGIEVFVMPVPMENFGTGSVYSDRLFQHDHASYNRFCREVWGNEGQYFYDRTPNGVSKFLSLYYGRKVQVYLVKECCNQATGYPVWYFQFTYMEKEHEVRVQE